MAVINELWSKPEVRAIGIWPFTPSPSGFVAESEVYHVSPRSVSSNDINFTSFPGKCSATLFSLMFWLGKLSYKVVKAEDSMEISPMHTQYYQITIQQKQTLERQIKEGLAGITQAITDFELLFHDLRKYKDFLNYFNAKDAAKKAKDDAAIDKANQSLKAVFIDQVDVHTGERVALRSIAGRWPTIISDFMRLRDSDTDPRKIAKEYGVSEAEGVVLATKNKLFVEWTDTFGRVVKDRYDRLLGMVKARKFSIDEYKEMLKPYIERYKSINEIGPGKTKEVSWLRPGAQAASFDTARIWAFKAMTRPEPTRITYENYGGKTNILKAAFCPSFMAIIKKNIDKLKEVKLDEIDLSPCGIEPLDKWVWALYKYIEEKYGVRFSLPELIRLRNKFVTFKDGNGNPSWGNAPEPYFKCLDFEVVRAIIRLPDGTELEDMVFNPLHFYMESHNMMFLRFLELEAQEKQLGKYMNEMLGDTTTGKKLSELTEEYEKLFKVFPLEEKAEKKEADEVDAWEDLHAARNKVQKQVEAEVGVVNSTVRFFNRGPYEARFDDIVTGPYFNDIGSSMGKVQTFLKAKFDVPGFSSPGVAG